jgi:tRNA uridine 5-carboxymethylaminomethyl modification enzyme
LISLNSTPLKTAISLHDLIKRPELSYETLKGLDKDRKELPREIRLQVETQIKYEGYIKKQMAQIEQFKKLEGKRLEENQNYDEINGLSNEAKQKLNQIRPGSVGQASRISGISPADINVLLIYLEQKRRRVKGEDND